MIWIWAILGTACVAAAVFLIRRGFPVPSPSAAGDPSSSPADRLSAFPRQAPESGPNAAKGGAGLQGNLAQTPLHDLLQYLALGRKSGILELASGRRTGRVVLKDGRVYKDSFRGRDGLEALFMMLDLSQGDFEFYGHNPEDAPSHTGLEVVDIIMLWMERKSRKKA